MPEFDNKSFETQLNINESSDKKNELLKLFKELKIDGTEFINDFYNTLSEKDKTDIYKAFINFSQDKNNLKKIIITKGFPFDEDTLNDFISESKLIDLTNKEQILDDKEQILDNKKQILDNKEAEANDKIKNLEIREIDGKKDLIKFGSKLRKEERYKEFFIEYKDKKDEEITFEDYKKVIEGNWKKILDKARRDGGDEYKIIKEKFKEFNDSGIIFLKDFDLITKVFEDTPKQKVYGSEYKEIILTSLDTSKYENTVVNGNIITYGDQVITYDEKNNKYEKSIKSDESNSDLMLKSTEINYEIDRETKKKIYKLEKTLENNEKKFKDNNNIISNLQSNFDSNGNLIKDFAEINLPNGINNNLSYSKNKSSSEIKILEEKIKDPDEKENIDSNKTKINNIKDSFKKEIIEEIKKLQNENNEIKITSRKLFEEKEKLSKKEKERKEEYKKSIIEKDEKARENLKKLELVGFHLLGNDVKEDLLSLLNSDTALRGAIDLGKKDMKINTELNFSEGKYGQPEGKNGLEYLIRLTNKLITGDPTKPNNVNGILDGNIRNFSMDPNKFNKLLEDNGVKNSSTIKENIRRNLKLPIKTNNEEENKSGKPNNGKNKESIEKQKNNRI